MFQKRCTLLVLLCVLSINICCKEESHFIVDNNIVDNNIESDTTLKSISGYVYYLNKPASSATVMMDDSLKYKVYTDATGFFTIKDINAGKHKLRIRFELSDGNISGYDKNIDIFQSSNIGNVNLLKPSKLYLPTIVNKKTMNISFNLNSSQVYNNNTLFRFSDPELDIIDNEYLREFHNKNDSTIFVDIIDSIGYFYQVFTTNDSGYFVYSNIVSSKAQVLSLNNLYYIYHSGNLFSEYRIYTMEGDLYINNHRYYKYNGRYLRSTTSQVFWYINNQEYILFDLFWQKGDTVRNNFIVIEIGYSSVLDTDRIIIKLKSSSRAELRYSQTFGEVYFSSWDGVSDYDTKILYGARLMGQTYGNFPK